MKTRGMYSVVSNVTLGVWSEDEYFTKAEAMAKARSLMKNDDLDANGSTIEVAHTENGGIKAWKRVRDEWKKWK